MLRINSKEVKENDTFLALKGVKKDGHDYIEEAIKNGASKIICEHGKYSVETIIVPSTREYLSNYLKDKIDLSKVIMIGITGTNGKTTSAYLTYQLLNLLGIKSSYIGTIGFYIDKKVRDLNNTTPDLYDLYMIIDECIKNDVKVIVMEVSSHALALDRVYGIYYDIGVFTNLTQDHLDYHITMDNYLEAKKKLFHMCKTAVINSDDEYAERLMEGLSCNIVTYSTGCNSTYSANGINYKPASVEYELVSDNSINHIRVKTGGKFTVYNSMCAAVCALNIGIPIETVTSAIESLGGVKGRAEVVPCDRDFTIIIDYAHTPDGLKNILSTFKECKRNRLIAVFGCGGDRDKTKRPIMGSIAVHNADYVIVTSDNPRTEEPMAIINDILVGTEGSNTPCKVIENRIEAIKFAISTKVL